MPISVLAGGTQAGASINGGTVTLTFPTLSQNDVVVVYGGTVNRAGYTAIPSGYTTIFDAADAVDTGGSTSHHGASYKIMGATPDASVVCPGTGNAFDVSAFVCYCLRGVDLSTVLDAAATTTSSAGSATTNPVSPSITTVINNSYVLSLAISAVNDAAVTVPSGYGDQRAANATDTNPRTVGGAGIIKTAAGAENPASYTNWASGVWLAGTVAIRSAPDGVAWAQNSDNLQPRRSKQQSDVTFISPAGLIPGATPSGVAWSQRFEEFKGKPKFTDQPAYGIPPVPAVGISGVAFTQPLDYATPKKGRTDPAAMDPQFVAAVGISGVSWALRLDLAVPKKGRTEPPAYDPRSTPAVGISGIDWSQRFEPMFGKPIRLTMPPAYGIPPVPAVGISGVDWSQRSEPFFGRKAFTDPPVWTINIELVRVNPAIRPHGAVPKWRFLG